MGDGDKPRRAKRKRRPSHKVVSRRKSLATLIEHLPSVDITRSDLKGLVLQLALDVPYDAPDGAHAHRAKVKLDALRLLAELTKDADDTEVEKELLEILKGG